MNRIIALATVSAVLLLCVVVVAQDNPAPAKAPAAASAPAASAPTSASAPASKPAVLASIGEVKITSEQIDRIINANKERVSPDQTDAFREFLLDQAIKLELWKNYLDSQKIEPVDTDMKEYKETIAKAASQMGVPAEKLMSDVGITEASIRVESARRKLVRDLTADAKVDAFIKANPHYFDGTKVKASHILVLVPASSSSEKLKAAKAKLESIAAELKDGKITFEEAAKKYSDCPSKVKGGDLGEWTYIGDPIRRSGMDKVFSKAAFATKVGEVSPIVHTSFGFHIIKVTALTEGKDEADDFAKAAAKAGLVAEFEAANIFDLPMGKVVVVNNLAPASQPAE